MKGKSKKSTYSTTFGVDPLFYCGYKARMSGKDANTKKRNCGIKILSVPFFQFQWLFRQGSNLRPSD